MKMNLWGFEVRYATGREIDTELGKEVAMERCIKRKKLRRLALCVFLNIFKRKKNSQHSLAGQ